MVCVPIPYPTLYAHSARWRLGKKVIYDLGVRKDVASGSKLWQDMLANGAKLDAGPDVAETLVHHGIDLKSINAVIWGCVRDSFRCSPRLMDTPVTPTSTTQVTRPPSRRPLRSS